MHCSGRRSRQTKPFGHGQALAEPVGPRFARSAVHGLALGQANLSLDRLRLLSASRSKAARQTPAAFLRFRAHVGLGLHRQDKEKKESPASSEPPTRLSTPGRNAPGSEKAYVHCTKQEP
jgi:hypothetical protein